MGAQSTPEGDHLLGPGGLRGRPLAAARARAAAGGPEPAAAVAVAFAKFSGVLFAPFSEKNILFSIGSFSFSAAQLIGILLIVFLTWMNSKGIQYGKWIVRIFSSSKIIALFGIIILGIFVFGNQEVWLENTKDMWRSGTIAETADGISNSICADQPGKFLPIVSAIRYQHL